MIVVIDIVGLMIVVDPMTLMNGKLVLKLRSILYVMSLRTYLIDARLLMKTRYNLTPGLDPLVLGPALGLMEIVLNDLGLYLKLCVIGVMSMVTMKEIVHVDILHIGPNTYTQLIDDRHMPNTYRPNEPYMYNGYDRPNDMPNMSMPNFQMSSQPRPNAYNSPMPGSYSRPNQYSSRPGNYNRPNSNPAGQNQNNGRPNLNY